jgi:hypothetical protein
MNYVFWSINRLEPSNITKIGEQPFSSPGQSILIKDLSHKIKKAILKMRHKTCNELMDVFEKEWHQLTIEIYLDSAWSMIHLKTWDIFSTKHPKFLFFCFNLFEVFWFSLWNSFDLLCPLFFLNFTLNSTLIPLDFLSSSWIPRWFIDFHMSISQTEQKAQSTQQQAKQQTNSKQSRRVSLAWMLISTWIPLLFPNFHIEFPRWFIDFHTSFSSKANNKQNKQKKQNNSKQSRKAKKQNSTNRTSKSRRNKKGKKNSKQSSKSRTKDSLAWMLIPLEIPLDFHIEFHVDLLICTRVFK